MDWPNVEDPFLGEKEEGFFDYVEAEPRFEPDPKLASRALSYHGKELMLKLPLHWINMEENWDEWRSSLVLSRDLTKDPLLDHESASGYHILLSARVLPIQLSPLLESLNSLPFLVDDWRLVTSRFYLHNAVCEPMLDTLLSSYTTYLIKDHDSETLDMYTAVMSSDYEDFLAVSSTYFRKSRVTAAVVYGCNKKQMDHVERLLDTSPEVKSHPLLMVGVFEELQRKRLNKLHGDVGTEFVDIITDLDLSNSKKAELTWKQNTSIRNCRTRIRKLQEETRVAKCQLEKMMEQVTQLKSQPAGHQHEHKVAWPGIDLMPNTDRYLRRFKDICLEYEGMVATFQLWSDELAFTYELFMQDAALNEAKQSRHQAKAATVLAFVAMVYLPSSTVATIFAMPIFNWQARWWDIHAIFQAQSSADSASPSTNQTSSDPGPEAVLSGYFWIYFSVSLFMTLLTVVICFFYISDWTPVITFFSSIWATMKSLYRAIRNAIGGGIDGSRSTDDEKPISRKGTFKPPDGTSLMEIRRTATAEPPTSTDTASTTNPTNHRRASLLAPISTSTANLPPVPRTSSPSQTPPTQPPTPATTLRSIFQAVAATTSPVSPNLATSAITSESTGSHTITSPTPATVAVSISPASPKGDTTSEPQGGSSSTIANSGSTAARTT